MDALYAFFVQWTPDIYGDLDEIDPEIRGFVVIDDEEETEEENLEIIDEHFASIQKIRKDWEVTQFYCISTLSLSDRSFSVDPAAVWAIFRSNQWSTTGLSKAVVCTVLSMEKCI